MALWGSLADSLWSICSNNHRPFCCLALWNSAVGNQITIVLHYHHICTSEFTTAPSGNLVADKSCLFVMLLQLPLSIFLPVECILSLSSPEGNVWTFTLSVDTESTLSKIVCADDPDGTFCSYTDIVSGTWFSNPS